MLTMSHDRPETSSLFTHGCVRHLPTYAFRVNAARSGSPCDGPEYSSQRDRPLIGQGINPLPVFLLQPANVFCVKHCHGDGVRAAALLFVVLPKRRAAA